MKYSTSMIDKFTKRGSIVLTQDGPAKVFQVFADSQGVAWLEVGTLASLLDKRLLVKASDVSKGDDGDTSHISFARMAE